MYVTGAVDLAFFSFVSFLVAVPTGVKFYSWIGTLWGSSLSFDTPSIFALCFLVTFLFGGLTGVILASPALDFQLSVSCFVVAHFHYVVFGTVVFAMFAGFYFWWPKFTVLNEVSSVGAIILGASTLPFIYNVWKSRRNPHVGVDDPWGWGRSLEWATPCPPPRHNFTTLPRIRSESPAFDLHHPEIAAMELDDNPGLREGGGRPTHRTWLDERMRSLTDWTRARESGGLADPGPVRCPSSQSA